LAADGVAGGIGGYVHGQVSDELLEDISKQMKPGMFAVLAEVSEPWTAPVDTLMEALGGKVLRENRRDVVDDIIEKRAESRRARAYACAVFYGPSPMRASADNDGRKK